MIAYYLITTVLTLLSFIAMIVLFENKKINYYFMMLLLLMTLANGGYLAIALSSTVEEAILANKIVYLGGCFVPVVMLFLICTLAHYKVPVWVRCALYGYSFLVYAMVLTIGYTPFYYKETHLETVKNVSVIGQTYGTGHIFFYIILYGYIVIKVGLLLYTMFTKRAVSRKNLWILTITEVMNIILFIVWRMTDAVIEIMPLAYTINSWILLYMFRRGMMYSLEDNIAAALRERGAFGYIMFDKHLKYLGCNNMAARIFPDLSNCVIDKQIKNVPALTCIEDWVVTYRDQGNDTFSYKDKECHYECKLGDIRYHGKSHGYIVEMREDTNKWRYLNLLAATNAGLESKVVEQNTELIEKNERIRELFLETIMALSEAVEAKDRYTSGHSRRVAEYSLMIAKCLGKSEDEQDEIYSAGLLHDIGKIRIPGEIINKPGQLSNEEYNLIKIHPVTGYHILSGISGSEMPALGAKYHHERYDGAGYPNGISGESIPEVARIICVADSYDTMTSNRSYRGILPQEVVREEIAKGRGTQFDPQITDIMLQMIDEDKEYRMKQPDSMPHKILTVDDEAMNNKIITHIMKDEEMYTVFSVESGEAALEIMEQHTFSLIFLDIHLPDMDGLEILRRIRKKYETPVVLMTSDRELDLATEFKELGCGDYITKPFSPLLIKEIVCNIVEG